MLWEFLGGADRKGRWWLSHGETFVVRVTSCRGKAPTLEAGDGTQLYRLAVRMQLFISLHAVSVARAARELPMALRLCSRSAMALRLDGSGLYRAPPLEATRNRRPR